MERGRRSERWREGGGGVRDGEREEEGEMERGRRSER